MDLYTVLSVPSDADSDAVQRAYRKRAMETHPDRGGNADDFKLVQLAYDVLSDPERRASYDATGDVSCNADNSESKLAGVLAEAYNEAIANMLNSNATVDHTDIVDSMRSIAKKAQASAKELEAKLLKVEQAMSKSIERFQGNRADTLRAVASAGATQLQKQLLPVRQQLELLDKALEVLKTSRFACVLMPELQRKHTFFEAINASNP